MALRHLSSVALSIAALSLPVQSQDSSNTATVDLSTTRGAPSWWAAGFIYGEPSSAFDQSPSQIPLSYYTGMNFQYGRAGGGQDPTGGYITSQAGYESRFQSTKQNYQTSRAAGGKFQILPHDVWGTDHANQSSYWPGDNGNWTIYDNFLDQLLGDLQSNNMLDGLDWDLWNEPDGGFWDRSQDQYLAMWNRTYLRIRSDSAFDNVLIVGPSSAGQPSTGNSWWVNYVKYIVSTNTVPDQYTWHDEPGDPGVDIPNLATLLSDYNAPSRQVNINEYATYDQQTSSGSAWFISRLERYNAFGLRGNWLSACQLYDFMAGILTKADTNDCTSGDYQPNGQYQVYQWYAQNMTGVRATTTGTEDGNMDVYTTIGTDTVQTLTGVLDNTGTWYITIDNLSAVGLPESGSLPIQTYGLIDGGHFTAETSVTNRGIYSHTYSGNSVTFPVYQTSQDEYTAWVFEFAVGGKSL